ncbi:hypothetical protein K474DRAFT_1696605 [Panus rudis PR-1116 ss-1]|nr:hypothetical protein K474DRAFT_1696605 [Panus rudis PR-1116 ss-1]
MYKTMQEESNNQLREYLKRKDLASQSWSAGGRSSTRLDVTVTNGRYKKRGRQVGVLSQTAPDVRCGGGVRENGWARDHLRKRFDIHHKCLKCGQTTPKRSLFGKPSQLSRLLS